MVSALKDLTGEIRKALIIACESNQNSCEDAKNVLSRYVVYWRQEETGTRFREEKAEDMGDTTSFNNYSFWQILFHLHLNLLFPSYVMLKQ